MEEHVLVAHTTKVKEACDFQGFTNSDELIKVVHSSNVYVVRDVAEKDYSYKQLIPYIVFYNKVNAENKLKVLLYFRGKSGGENRLHSKASIGFGGHINYGDDNYFGGALREIQEELANVVLSKRDLEKSLVGFVNDDSNEVGKVHLGVVHFVDVGLDIDIKSREDAVEHPQWVPLDELNKYNLETWSQLCLTELNKLI
jgi:predicted NUDIX family phosphoesterase